MYSTCIEKKSDCIDLENEQREPPYLPELRSGPGLKWIETKSDRR